MQQINIVIYCQISPYRRTLCMRCYTLFPCAGWWWWYIYKVAFDSSLCLLYSAVYLRTYLTIPHNYKADVMISNQKCKLTVWEEEMNFSSCSFNAVTAMNSISLIICTKQSTNTKMIRNLCIITGQGNKTFG